MTIDEAIEHAKEVARTCDDSKCAAEHIQLAEWLRQARGADKAQRWYTAKLGEARLDMSNLMTENAKMRELVHDMGFLIAWADWNTVKDDERAYQLICRAEEIGIEVHQ